MDNSETLTALGTRRRQTKHKATLKIKKRATRTPTKSWGTSIHPPLIYFSYFIELEM